MNNLKTKVKLVILHLIYFLILSIVYVNYLVVNYEYIGLKSELNIYKLIISPLIITVTVMVLRFNYKSSTFFLHLILTIIITPSLIIVGGSNLEFSFALWCWLAFFILTFVVYFIKIPNIKIKNNLESKMLLNILLYFTLIYVTSIFLLGGYKYINFDFSKVYDFREEAASNLPSIYAYLTPNFTYAIIPTSIALALNLRRYLTLSIFLVCTILIFSLTSHKGPLFIAITVIVAFYFSNSKINIHFMLIVFTLLCCNFFAESLFKSTEFDFIWIWINSLIAFRTLILPNYINFQHYEFFSNNPYYFWADSKISLGLITSSYQLPMPYQISYAYMGIEGMGSANTGWIGSGIGHAGILGLVIYSIIMGLIISFIDTNEKKFGKSLILPIFIIPLITAVQSVDITTMILTNGLLLQIILLFLFKPMRK